jgi:hypothetical protein
MATRATATPTAAACLTGNFRGVLVTTVVVTVRVWICLGICPPFSMPQLYHTLYTLYRVS